MALSRHGLVHCKCPLLGVKRTSQLDRVMSVFDPERKSHLVARRTKSVIVLHAPDFMYRHPAFDRYENLIPEEVNYTKIAIRVPVMNKVQLLLASKPRKPLKP